MASHSLAIEDNFIGKFVEDFLKVISYTVGFI